MTPVESSSRPGEFFAISVLEKVFSAVHVVSSFSVNILKKKKKKNSLHFRKI